MQYRVNVTWLNHCHTAVLNDNLTLQKVTKVHLKWPKNLKFKNSLWFPRSVLQYAPLPPKTRKMNLFFDLLKLFRILNFQKKLVKKLTQLIFEKNWWQIKLYVTLCDHLKLLWSWYVTSMLAFALKCGFQYRSHRQISFKSAKNLYFTVLTTLRFLFFRTLLNRNQLKSLPEEILSEASHCTTVIPFDHYPLW